MQRTDEWTKNYNRDYFDRQFTTPYRSTVKFCDWLERLGVLTPDLAIKLLDVGTGKGANIYYMAKRFPNIKFTGVDINPDFVNEGNAIMKANALSNRCNLQIADIYAFDKQLVNQYQGIVSYQTLSWLPDYAEPLKSMANLNPDWIALTSLFFDGDVNCKVELEEYNNSIAQPPKKTFYNVYALPLVERHFRNLGYTKFHFVPFEMDIDLPKPGHRIMGTYTERLEDGHRIQISGPLLMNWYFVLAQR